MAFKLLASIFLHETNYCQVEDSIDDPEIGLWPEDLIPPCATAVLYISTVAILFHIAVQSWRCATYMAGDYTKNECYGGSWYVIKQSKLLQPRLLPQPE